MPLISGHYYRRVCWLFLCGNGRYQNTLKCSFREVETPQEAWDQSCTSAVVWLVLSLLSLLASEHRWRFICCLFPLDSFSFSIPIFLCFLPSSASPPPLLQEPVCQQKPCTSPCAYQTVYPFPVGAVLHLWLWQPIATPRVHSKPWFRHPALPAMLHQPPLVHSLMWIFHTEGAWSFPNAKKLQPEHENKPTLNENLDTCAKKHPCTRLGEWIHYNKFKVEEWHEKTNE